jgi:integration host factor subunit alpha
MTVTKADLTEKLMEEPGLPPREARALVDDFFEAIGRALIQGEPVRLSGFGHFTLRDKRPRPGRNPRTGEACPVDARRVVTFKPGIPLKSHVARFKGEPTPLTEAPKARSAAAGPTKREAAPRARRLSTEPVDNSVGEP